MYFQRRCRLKFFLPYGPMLTKTKKNRKKSKILHFEKQKKKNGLEIWWIGTCPTNLALIQSVVSEKTMSTDDGRTTTDARVTTVALLCSGTNSRLANTVVWQARCYVCRPIYYNTVKPCSKDHLLIKTAFHRSPGVYSPCYRTSI